MGWGSKKLLFFAGGMVPNFFWYFYIYFFFGKKKNLGGGDQKIFFLGGPKKRGADSVKNYSIGATIRIGQEILCPSYAGLFYHVFMCTPTPAS